MKNPKRLIIIVIFLSFVLSCNKTKDASSTKYSEEKVNDLHKIEKTIITQDRIYHSNIDFEKLSFDEMHNDISFDDIVKIILTIDETKIENKDYSNTVKLLLTRLTNYTVDRDKQISKIRRFDWSGLGVVPQESIYCWKISSPNLTVRVVNKVGSLLFSSCVTKNIDLYEEAIYVLSSSNCDAALPYLWNVMNSIDGKITDHPLAIVALRGIRSRASVLTALNYYGENKIAQKVVLKMLTNKNMDVSQFKKWIYDNIEYIQFNDDGYMYLEKDLWGMYSTYEYFLPPYNKILTLTDK